MEILSATLKNDPILSGIKFNDQCKRFLPSYTNFYQNQNNQEFLREKTIPQCQTPSQNQEATEFQGYSLPVPSLLGQT
jgi:hypothetical protein